MIGSAPSAAPEKRSRRSLQRASFAAGGALGYMLGWNTDMVGSLRWSKTLTGAGAVWSEGDSPAYMSWTLGLRYPHETH